MWIGTSFQCDISYSQGNCYSLLNVNYIIELVWTNYKTLFQNFFNQIKYTKENYQNVMENIVMCIHSTHVYNHIREICSV